jgi:hypothetical protein
VDAQARLRERIEQLPLEQGTTVRDAVKDSRWERAVLAAVRRARAYKTVYQPNGTVEVHMEGDMRDLWDELRR